MFRQWHRTSAVPLVCAALPAIENSLLQLRSTLIQVGDRAKVCPAILGEIGLELVHFGALQQFQPVAVANARWCDGIGRVVGTRCVGRGVGPGSGHEPDEDIGNQAAVIWRPMQDGFGQARQPRLQPQAGRVPDLNQAAKAIQRQTGINLHFPFLLGPQGHVGGWFLPFHPQARQGAVAAQVEEGFGEARAVIQLLGPEVFGIKQHPGGVVGSIGAQGSGITEPAIPTGLAGYLIGLFLMEWRGGAHGCPQVWKEWSSRSAEWRVGVAKEQLGWLVQRRQRSHHGGLRS